MSPSALVTDGQWNKSLAVCRSLGRAGVDVTVTGDSRFTTTFFSKHCSKRVIVPPKATSQSFLRAILAELAEQRYDVLLPMEDDTLLLCAEHHRELSRYARVPIPPMETIMKARDKAQTIHVAESIGIPCPKTFFVQDLAHLDHMTDRISFPIVIKPREGSGSQGIAYIESPQDFRAAYLQIHSRFPFPLIQERIPPGGAGLGFSALLDENQECKAFFMHKRLREFPISGGPSTYRESIYDEKLRELGMRLLKALNWYGVAMVEFKIDPRDGQPKLMEVNPRFWGSLQLAILAGVDFPALLFQMATGKKLGAPPSYKNGIRCKWLLPGDILACTSRFLRSKNPKEIAHLFDASDGDDILSWEDPFPTIGRLTAFGRYVLDTQMWLRFILRA